MRKASPLPQPHIEAQTYEFQRNGNVFHGQRFYEVDEDGNRLGNIKAAEARELLAPHIGALLSPGLVEAEPKPLNYAQKRIKDLEAIQEKSYDRQSDLEERLNETDFRNSPGMISWSMAKIEKWGRSKLSAIRERRIKLLQWTDKPRNPETEAATKQKKGWNGLVTGLRTQTAAPFRGTQEQFTNGEDEIDIAGWLNAAREDLARLSAKSRFSIFRDKKGLAQARQNYESAFAMYVATEMLELQEADKVQYTAQQFKEAATMVAVQEITERTHLEAEYVLKTRRGKFLNWYSNLSTAKKIAVGGVAGVAVGAMGLVAGAGVAVAGGALLRFGRGKFNLQARDAARKLHDADFRGKLSEYHLESNLDEAGFAVDETASREDNTHRRADLVTSTVRQGDYALAKYDRRKARTAAAIGAASAIGGYVAGKAINGWVHGKSHTSTGRGGRNGSGRPGSGSTTTGPNAAPNTPNSAPTINGPLKPNAGAGNVILTPNGSTTTTELVSRITPGRGLIDNLTHPSVGLTPAQATNAVAQMRAEGLLDGTHIAGVAERGNDIVVYLRGAGDGALHYTDPRVLEIISQAKNS